MAADITDYKSVRSGRFVSGLIGIVFSLTDSIVLALVPINIGVIIVGAGYTQINSDVCEPLNQSLFNSGLTIAIIIPLILIFKA